MIVRVSARVGCLGLSVIAAIGLAAITGSAFRARWFEPPPLRPVTAAEGQRSLDAAVNFARQRGLRDDSSGTQTATVLSTGWSAFDKRIDVGANECVAIVVASVEGYAAPKHAGLFDGASSEGTTFQNSVFQTGAMPYNRNRSWLQVASRDALSVTLGWCARQPTALDARVMLSTLDGTTPPRRADATVKWQVLRAPWSAVGGPSRMPTQTYTNEALAALAATFEEPLAEATREPPEPGLVPVEPSHDAPMGSAALIPVMRATVALLWDMSARNSGATGSGISVHPRIAGPLSLEEQTVINTTFTELAAGRVIPPEHDPIVDLGRNDFYRVVAVLDTGSIQRECQLVTLTRGEGLFAPRVSRYSRLSGQRTAITRTRNNVAIDRVCPGDVLTYLTDDTDQKTYRVTIWQPAGAAPAQAASPTRGRRG